MLKLSKKAIVVEGIPKIEKEVCDCRLVSYSGSIGNDIGVTGISYILSSLKHLNGKNVRVTIEVLDD